MASSTDFRSGMGKRPPPVGPPTGSATLPGEGGPGSPDMKVPYFEAGATLPQTGGLVRPQAGGVGQPMQGAGLNMAMPPPPQPQGQGNPGRDFLAMALKASAPMHFGGGSVGQRYRGRQGSR